MATINDFKLIKVMSLKRFGFIKNLEKKEIDEISKERIGFYHLVLEGITGIIEEDIKGDKYTIIDSAYNKLVNGVGIDDYGIDVVYISEPDERNEININLFNFKYRTNFNLDKTKTEGDISRSTKFLEYIVSEKKQNTKVNSLVSKLINEIIDLLSSNNICNINLYMVSNEANSFQEKTNEYINLLETSYDMKIINISLDDIINFFNEKKDNQASKFLIGSNEFLSFESDEKSTQKSYIVKLSLLDLIRITSTDNQMVENYSLENDDKIRKARLNYSLLYDNVRGFLGETKYNTNIIQTLTNDHLNFFSYNNGITITAEKIDSESKNSGKKYLFTIQNFQVVNGGQTLRSIYEFLNNDNEQAITKLREAHVLVRVFKVNNDDELKNKVAEYTNSQNAISNKDLKSVDRIQIEIERYLAEHEILYVRKAGDLGDTQKKYSNRISMEKMSQLLYSHMGFPDRASNQKTRLFQDYYNDIFHPDSFSIELCRKVFEEFEEIKKQYNLTMPKVKVYDQKLFYIIFIMSFSGLSTTEAIQSLENLLVEYQPPKSTSEPRKLLHKKFKQLIITKLNITLH